MKKLIYLLLVLLLTSCEKNEVEQAVPTKPQPQQPVVVTDGCIMFFLYSGSQIQHQYGVDIYVEGNHIGLITKKWGGMFPPTCSYTDGVRFTATYEGYYNYYFKDHFTGVICGGGTGLLRNHHCLAIIAN